MTTEKKNATRLSAIIHPSDASALVAGARASTKMDDRNAVRGLNPM
jgi:hypothetical protein